MLPGVVRDRDAPGRTKEVVMSKTVLVAIADGSEELEAVCIVDVLRRTDATVTLASVDGIQIVASKGIRLTADCLIADCADKTYDLIALPGGMPGAEHLRDSAVLIDMLRQQKREGRLYAAICSAPAVVFHPQGLLEGKRATCHPSFSHLIQGAGPVEETVVVDGNLVTSRGAGTAVEFSLKLVELLYGTGKMRDVAKGMVI
jgi:4-methyl-5(b-hydroxyethyl)-thiazole monophosphate biosynthesis